jgi:transcription antitermination factor NusG
MRKSVAFSVQKERSGGSMNPDCQDRKWYALQIRPRFEKLASKGLRDKGYEEYVPTYTSRRRWSDRMKIVELPLFPGYAFCKFEVQKRLPILLTPGVVSIVGIGNTPAAISEKEISSVQRIVASRLVCGPWPFVQVGDRVLVERGPLAGLEGTVVEVKSSLRLILSLPLLQRSVAVEIDSDCIGKPDRFPSCLTPAASNSSFGVGSHTAF